MKILMIMDHLSSLSGVSSFVMNLYRHIDKKSFQFDFLVCEQRPKEISYEEEILRLGGEIYYFGNPLAIKSFFRANKQCKLFFKNNAKKYDVVHLHSPTLARFTLKYAKKYGVKNLIAHSHSTMSSKSHIKRLINCFLTANITSLANRYWACSTEAAYYLYGKKFCQRNAFEVIRNAIDGEKYAFNPKIRCSQRTALGLNDNATVYVHISNFSPIKNHIFLLPIMQEVIKHNANTIFLFVGDGETRKEFEDAVMQMGVHTNCIFVGRKKNVTPYLFAADAFILPSLKEGLPVTAIEAQATGLSCLISDTVTRECDIGNVKFIPIETKYWIKELPLMKIHSEERRFEFSQEFMLNKFCMKNESDRVEKLYIGIKNGEK